MPKSDIPTPNCATCRESGSEHHKKGETFYRCENCGTEMRYMPAGELLNSGGSKGMENNGWVPSFSVTSSEMYSSKAMLVLGFVTLILTIIFLLLGKIASDAALWSAGSGIVLGVIGRKRLIRQKNKAQLILDKYPYWKK